MTSFYDEKMFPNETSPFEFLSLEKGCEWTNKDCQCRIILLLKGLLKITFAKREEMTISSGKMFFLPLGQESSIATLERSSVLIISMKDESCFDGLGMDEKNHDECDKRLNMHCLQISDVLSEYIRSLQVYNSNEINSNLLYTLKMKELIYIIKASYSQTELNRFFYIYQISDLLFTGQVRQQSESIKNVRELAERMNYSYSGFNKRFRKAFGISAYSWLRKRRANMVYHDIYYTNKSLKQISTENMFSTLSHFNEFCHKNLGNSPSEIRRRRKNKKQTSVTLQVTEVCCMHITSIQRYINFLIAA
ncbi:helix-turn-helix domain-containing protein [Dysgonomonas sp. 520]|uniref:helix-turn-helix domain-containing protein n=1 Tax=Dysgonomonas sp. 520 TaxID=2302931 RepID=UPI0013D46528|nr:helix-turn-helix domain-containing protein [Dysgonomonas sp. 520]NDW08155.1 AraC family transcriptional regulator [Dysgonomonas sp. 520]